MHCLGQIPCSMSALLQPASGHVKVEALHVGPGHIGVHMVPVQEEAGEGGGSERAGIG